MFNQITNLQVAEVFLRVFLGVLFFFQGYDKLFVVKVANVIETFKGDAERKNIPDFAIVFISYFTSISELVGGAFLILGLFHQIVVYWLAIDLLLVSVAFSILNPVWDLAHVFPRVILIVILLFLGEYYYFGVDALINKYLIK